MSTYEESRTHLSNLKAVFADFAQRSDQFDDALASCIKPMLPHAYWAELGRDREGLYARELCEARLAAHLFHTLPESYGDKITNFPKTCRELWDIMARAYALVGPKEAAEFEETLFCSKRLSQAERQELHKCIAECLSSYAERSPSTIRNIIRAIRRQGTNMDDAVVHALTKVVSRFASPDVKRSLFAKAI